jgi:hypothetical protein
MGQLRSGVQKANYQTAYGPVMEQARKQGTGEMLARGAMGLAGGPIGMALAQIGTKEYGLPGVTGFERFDPNNPNPGGGILGQFLGGLNPTQAKDALVGAFAPVVPAPEPTPIDIAPVNTTGFEEKRSQHPLTGEKTVKTSGPLQGPPQLIDQSISPLNMDIGLDYPGTEFDRRITGSFTETGDTMDDAREKALQAAFRSPEEQLAGSLYDTLFRDPNISPEARGILKEKGMTIDDLFAPKAPSPVEEKPDIMDLIEKATQTSALGGSSTANQYAQVDYSNLNNVGGNIYQAGQQKSAFDSFLETFGMKEAARRPSGQIYSPAGNNKPFFDYFGFGQ